MKKDRATCTRIVISFLLGASLLTTLDRRVHADEGEASGGDGPAAAASIEPAPVTPASTAHPDGERLAAASTSSQPPSETGHAVVVGGPGAPILARTSITSVGDVRAQGRAGAGEARSVGAPGTIARAAFSTSPPRRRTSFASGTNELLARYRRELAACLPSAPDPGGLVLVKAAVGADGRATSSSVSSFSGVSSTVATCLAAVSARAVFVTHGTRAAVVPLRLVVADLLRTDVRHVSP